MKSVTIHAAKTHLSALIEEVQTGSEIIIARGKEPVARLLPFQPPKRVFGTLKGKIKVDERVFEPLTPEELSDWEGEL